VRGGDNKGDVTERRVEFGSGRGLAKSSAVESDAVVAKARWRYAPSRAARNCRGMRMAEIKAPPTDPKKGKVTDISSFLTVVGNWQIEQEKRSPSGGEGFLGQLWYRGVNQQFPSLIPGVYRPSFTALAKRKYSYGNVEAKRLHLERDMLGDFRTAGAAFLDGASVVDLYFRAQHVGIPTRLLDWSTNPLAALFFACDGEFGMDGAVYAMVAREIIPAGARRTTKEKLHQAVMSMRHPFVQYAIGLAFWNPPKDDHHPHVLPVRPDVILGRIGQQSSCFTLHMHNALPTNNDSLVTIPIDADSKTALRDELHRLNINQFTTYYDLDHLSKEIKRCWGLEG